MNEKQLTLMETGMKLFAENGYHATSIQEIAAEAGVSKGAFYLYFHSKEHFLATSIQFYHHRLTKQINQVEHLRLSPKEKLAEQITVLAEHICKFKDFITMYLRENMPIGKYTDDLFQQIKRENIQWLKTNITSIYKEAVEDYLMDVIIQFEGLLTGYLKWMVLDDVDIDERKLGPFLVDRLDDLVRGLIQRDAAPLTTLDICQTENNGIVDVIQTIKKKLLTLPLTEKKINQLYDALTIIEKESFQEKPQSTIIQGMLAHLRTVPELAEESEQIASLFDIELLD